MTPSRWIRWFAIANLAFLAVDIAIAHEANHFRERAEWVPIAFSLLAPVFLLPGALGLGPSRARAILDVAVGGVSVLVGIAGMVLHLSSAFFEERTLQSLVYSAPFVAPLAYVGVGLLVLLVRLEKDDSIELGRWAMVLAFGGFVGNLALSLLDHAQNGFFTMSEWIPVVAAGYGCAFFGVALVRLERSFLEICLRLCGLEALVGVIGFVFHVTADARRHSSTLASRFVFGAPAFAPLLFTNLAFLMALAIWAVLRVREREQD